jgi:hypothetical protein
LATHSYKETLELCRAIAFHLGEVNGERLRRVDLASDYTDFPLEEMGQDALVTQRSKTVSFHTQAKDVLPSVDFEGGDQADVRVYRRSDSTITGYVVSPGNCLMARLYCKTTELRHPGREHKRELEYSIWKSNGWDGESAVTRVEFQVRGEALDDFKIRDPKDLEKKLDSIWQYCTQQWLRVVDVDTSIRRARCALLPCWDVVRTTVFLHPDVPAVRLRVRGGATMANMFGTLCSALGRTARLPQIAHGAMRHLVDKLEHELIDYTKQTLDALFAETRKAFMAEMIERHGWREACHRILAKIQSTAARFATSDNDEYFAAPVFDPERVREGQGIPLPNGESFYPISNWPADFGDFATA